VLYRKTHCAAHRPGLGKYRILPGKFCLLADTECEPCASHRKPPDRSRTSDYCVSQRVAPKIGWWVEAGCKLLTNGDEPVYNLHTPLGTQIFIYHHFTNPLTAAFLALFASQAVSWTITSNPRMLLCTPYSHDFSLYSTEETIKGFALLRNWQLICHLPLKLVLAMPPAAGGSYTIWNILYTPFTPK